MALRTVTFVVPGQPKPKERPRFTKHGGVYTPKASRDAEQAVGWHFAEETNGGWTVSDRMFHVKIHFFVEGRQRGDIDNLEKLVMDGLNRVAWKDDSQVVEVWKRIDPALDGNPRTVVTLSEV